VSDIVKQESTQQGLSDCCKGLAPLSECKCERENYASLLEERERLKEALEKIAHDAYTRADHNLSFPEPTMIWQAVARAALSSISSGNRQEPESMARQSSQDAAG
jgi:hypothetical protein